MEISRKVTAYQIKEPCCRITSKVVSLLKIYPGSGGTSQEYYNIYMQDIEDELMEIYDNKYAVQRSCSKLE